MLEKSEIALELYKIINLYSDYLEIGFVQENESPDFSFWDKIIIDDKKNLLEEKNREEQKIIYKQKSNNEDILAYNTSSIKTDNKKDIIHNNIKETKINNTKTKEIIKLAENIVKCRDCHLSTESKVITGAGNPDSPIVVISDYVSSKYEEETSIPLNGKELDSFKKWVEAIDIDSSNLFWTHIIKCRPKKSKITADSIKCCLRHLDNQLNIIMPKFIFALGNRVATVLNNGKPFSFISKDDFFYYKNIKVFTLFHPREVEVNQELKKPLWSLLKKIKNYYIGRE